MHAIFTHFPFFGIHCSLCTCSYSHSTFLILILPLPSPCIFVSQNSDIPPLFFVHSYFCLPYIYGIAGFVSHSWWRGFSCPKPVAIVCLINSISCCISSQWLCPAFMSVLNFNLIYPVKSITFLQDSQIIFRAWKLGHGGNMWFRDRVSKLLLALLPEVLPLTRWAQRASIILELPVIY